MNSHSNTASNQQYYMTGFTQPDFAEAWARALVQAIGKADHDKAVMQFLLSFVHAEKYPVLNTFLAHKLRAHPELQDELEALGGATTIIINSPDIEQHRDGAGMLTFLRLWEFLATQAPTAQIPIADFMHDVELVIPERQTMEQVADCLLLHGASIASRFAKFSTGDRMKGETESTCRNLLIASAGTHYRPLLTALAQEVYTGQISLSPETATPKTKYRTRSSAKSEEASEESPHAPRTGDEYIAFYCHDKVITSFWAFGVIPENGSRPQRAFAATTKPVTAKPVTAKSVTAKPSQPEPEKTSTATTTTPMGRGVGTEQPSQPVSRYCSACKESHPEGAHTTSYCQRCSSRHPYNMHEMDPAVIARNKANDEENRAKGVGFYARFGPQPA
jgi:hypothetical protein